MNTNMNNNKNNKKNKKKNPDSEIKKKKIKQNKLTNKTVIFFHDSTHAVHFTFKIV